MIVADDIRTHFIVIRNVCPSFIAPNPVKDAIGECVVVQLHLNFFVLWCSPIPEGLDLSFGPVVMLISFNYPTRELGVMQGERLESDLRDMIGSATECIRNYVLFSRHMLNFIIEFL